MEAFSGWHAWTDAVVLLSLSTTRLAVALLLLPLFSPDTLPPLVRNAVLVSLGVLVLAWHGPVSPAGWSAAHWLLVLGKEAAIGLALGFGLAAFLWAFNSAGQMLDTKLGLASVQLTDPMSGQQVSTTAALLGRMASLLFMSGGGFLMFVGLLLESFAAWPLGSTAWAPRLSGIAVFEQAMGGMMSLALLIAAPVMVIGFAIDLALGLVSRHAPQLNVSAVSSALKGLASTGVWLLALSTLVEGFGEALAHRLAAMLPALARVLGA